MMTQALGTNAVTSRRDLLRGGAGLVAADLLAFFKA
jgi:hypothetical protein